MIKMIVKVYILCMSFPHFKFANSFSTDLSRSCIPVTKDRIGATFEN